MRRRKFSILVSTAVKVVRLVSSRRRSTQTARIISLISKRISANVLVVHASDGSSGGAPGVVAKSSSLQFTGSFVS
ncbi:hypothetical protein RRF57_003790 [Xylaria bambusicola]|uniref:Uncharacterized protein n=1 Tax=Xylaria bambusicola TaxID=326684 RepID=A0AAN7U9I5_9PEZI